MKILFLSAWYPFPPNNGSKLRIYNLLRGLAQQHEVTLLTFTSETDVDTDHAEARTFCHEIHVAPRKSFDPWSWRARLGFLSLKPRAVVDTFSPEAAQSLMQLLRGEEYDLVIASQIDSAGYGRFFQGVPALLEEIEVGFLYEQFARATSARQRLRYGLTWAKHQRYVRRLMPYFKACTLVSEPERELFTKMVTNSRPLEIIPNCVDVAGYEDVRVAPRPNTLIFAGAFSYWPNYEAMVWFLREVYPRIQARVPEVCLTITGNHGNRPLPTRDGVTLTGFVDDVRPLIASSWISLAPILTGGGTRLKILEAMALHTPVVATSKGAEGLALEDGKHILIEDEPEAFAEVIVRLLHDACWRQQLVDNAYQLVHTQYDWAAVMPRFLNLIERVASS